MCPVLRILDSLTSPKAIETHTMRVAAEPRITPFAAPARLKKHMTVEAFLNFGPARKHLAQLQL
jgi:hypothetical protein